MKAWVSVSASICVVWSCLGVSSASLDPVPRLLFKAGFDGTGVAEQAAGDPRPQRPTRKLNFVPGRRGQALAMSRGCGRVLCYQTAGNLNLTRGTVAFWFKPDGAARATCGSQDRRFFFCTETANPRAGSGTLWFWQYGLRLRGDQSDDGDLHVMAGRVEEADGWRHIVYTWGEQGVRIYVNGRRSSTPKDSASLLATAFKKK